MVARRRYRFVMHIRCSAQGNQIPNWGAGLFNLHRGQMALAAVVHMFVFSATPYHYIPTSSQYGKVTTQETKAVLTIEEGNEEKEALVEKRETEVESPRTSVRESVQDIVVEGGQKVVKDVVLTINQAIEPVHEGMTKIQETFHHVSVSEDSKEEPEVKVEEHEELITKEFEV